jgi:hypothetical protein
MQSILESASMTNQVIYTIGGTVPTTGGIYIKRRADDVLLGLCRAGEYLHVLSPTQMGKSSPIVNIAKKIEAEGFVTVYVDLTGVGMELDPEKWFLGFLYEVCDSLSLNFDIFSWWQEKARLGFVQRISLFIKDVLLQLCDKQIVIFVDEIDIALDLPFAHDFFGVIRSLHARRDKFNDLSRISVVLVGTSTIQELTKGSIRWLNIGKTIQVDSFEIDEAIPLARGFCESDAQAKKILEWVFKWTNGHPYLTQVLCARLFAVSSDKKNKKINENIIDQIAKREFLSGLDNLDNNIVYIQNKLLELFHRNPALMKYYYKILCGETLQDNEHLDLIVPLKSIGLVSIRGGKVQISNKIYAAAFNQSWLQVHFPQISLGIVQPNRTVFISYRRLEGKYAARSVYLYLANKGYDVFLDVENIPSGEFESIILNQIASRVHFLVILNPGSLDRCNFPGDWLRKEIEFALELRRNIVPLMFDGFTFSDNKKNLSGRLSALANYNGIEVTNDLFEQTMEKLISRFLHLNNPVEITPPPDDDLPVILEKIRKTKELLSD